MFPVRYLQNTSSAELHLAEDVLPFQWCCVDSFPLGDRYCELYLEKRPLATSENYDQLCPGEYRLQHISIGPWNGGLGNRVG